MWRLLVVLALCGASLAQEEQQWASCNNITTVQNVSLTEGNWTARKVLQKDSFFPAATICFLSEISNISDDGLKMIVESRYKQDSDGKEKVEKDHVEYKAIVENKGRWNLEKENFQSFEMLLVSTDPSNFLMVAMCAPASQVTREEMSSELKDSVLFRVFVFTRRQGSYNGNISEENLAKKIDDAIKNLGLENYGQRVYTNPNC